MKKKRIIILALQVVIILVSVFMLNNYVKNQIKPTEAYVYAKNINDSTKPLKENDIKKVVIPKQAINKSFALNEKEILDMCVDSKVKAGQYIYKNQLIKLEEVDIFKTLDLSKYRKISLPITFVDSLAGNIKKGDKVDLVYTSSGSTTGEDSSSFNYSKVFMQDVLIYSVNTSEGYQYEDRSDYSKDDYTEEKSSNDKQNIQSITLAVTLEQAEEIEVRTNTGKVRLLGRFDDSKTYNTLGYVLGDYEKIFSGQGFAETDRGFIEEDDFDLYELDDIENMRNDKE